MDIREELRKISIGKQINRKTMQRTESIAFNEDDLIEFIKKIVGQLEPLVIPKTEMEKMILYKEVLLDLVEYAELERDREQSYVVVELFKNRFKKQGGSIQHVWAISNKIGSIINHLI